LQIQVDVQDLVHADRFRLRHRFYRLGFALDLIDGRPCNRKHDDERHLALRARDLKVEALLLVAENLDVAALQAATTHRAVVKASPVANELDDAHAPGAHITPASDGPRCTCTLSARRPPSAPYRPAAPSGRRPSARAGAWVLRGRM